jgi:hypothetical protein
LVLLIEIFGFDETRFKIHERRASGPSDHRIMSRIAARGRVNGNEGSFGSRNKQTARGGLASNSTRAD